MITWERGTGVTLACGTGATSTVLAGYKLGSWTKRSWCTCPGESLKLLFTMKEIN